MNSTILIKTLLIIQGQQGHLEHLEHPEDQVCSSFKCIGFSERKKSLL